MTSRVRSGYTSNMIQTIRRPRVSVCTSAQAFNVQAFIDALLLKCTEVISDVRYFELPYNDIDAFQFRNTDIDVMILCHSINNRRFAITDVMDAIYDRFLRSGVRALGSAKICVLVHDFQAEKLYTVEKYQGEMNAFRLKQPTTFECAKLVMMGGKLDEKVELGDNQWEELQAFLVDAGRSPPSVSTANMNCPEFCLDMNILINESCQSVQRSPQRQFLCVIFIFVVGVIIVLVVLIPKQTK